MRVLESESCSNKVGWRRRLEEQWVEILHPSREAVSHLVKLSNGRRLAHDAPRQKKESDPLLNV